MSRSHKKNPICGITCSESDKKFKKQEHSRARSYERIAISKCIANDGDFEPKDKKFGSPWMSSKDGKQYWHEESAMANGIPDYHRWMK